MRKLFFFTLKNAKTSKGTIRNLKPIFSYGFTLPMTNSLKALPLCWFELWTSKYMYSIKKGLKYYCQLNRRIIQDFFKVQHHEEINGHPWTYALPSDFFRKTRLVVPGRGNLLILILYRNFVPANKRLFYRRSIPRKA